jgi:beta-mannosidase
MKFKQAFYRIVCFGLMMAAFVANAQAKIVNLHNGWQFRQDGEPKWHAATVPGEVHTDLLKTN